MPAQILTRTNLVTLIEDPVEAGRLAGEAHDLALAHHGVDSFEYAAALASRATAWSRAGQHTRRLEDLQAALEKFEKRGRERRVFSAQTTLARWLIEDGRLEEAEPYAKAAIESSLSLYGSPNPARAAPLLARAELHAARGEIEAALRGIADAERELGETKDRKAIREDIEALRQRLESG